VKLYNPGDNPGHRDVAGTNTFICLKSFNKRFSFSNFLWVLFRGVTLTAAVIALVLVSRICAGCCFTGQFIMIGNCVPSHLRATVHGLSMSASCAARLVWLQVSVFIG
jgi:hypothetical protein